MLGRDSSMDLLRRHEHHHRDHIICSPEHPHLPTSHASAQTAGGDRMLERSDFRHPRLRRPTPLRPRLRPQPLPSRGPLPVDALRPGPADRHDCGSVRALSSRVPGVLPERHAEAGWGGAHDGAAVRVGDYAASG